MIRMRTSCNNDRSLRDVPRHFLYFVPFFDSFSQSITLIHTICAIVGGAVNDSIASLAWITLAAEMRLSVQNADSKSSCQLLARQIPLKDHVCISY